MAQLSGPRGGRAVLLWYRKQYHRHWFAGAQFRLRRSRPSVHNL